MFNRPQASSGDICPFHRKDVSKVCHKCPLYVNVKGKNPQDEEVVDRWGCSFTFAPMLSIETSQMVRQSTASTDNLRKEMRETAVIGLKQNQELLHIMVGGIQQAQLERKL